MNEYTGGQDISNRKFEIEVNGKKVGVSFSNKYNDVGHLEFHGKATSESGYRSHFFFWEELGNMTIEEFALWVAKELAKNVKCVPDKLTRWLA